MNSTPSITGVVEGWHTSKAANRLRWLLYNATTLSCPYSITKCRFYFIFFFAIIFLVFEFSSQLSKGQKAITVVVKLV